MRQKEFWAGVRGSIPLVVGAIPFGIIFGTLSSSSGLSFAGAMAMSAFVFAGSAQFIALGLIATETSLWVILFTTFIVNLRHLLYSVTLVPHIRDLSQRWKISLAFWLTDEAFVLAINRYNQDDRSPDKHWYYLGAASFFYLNWLAATLIGLTVGQLLPNATRWGLDFAMAVTFIGLVIPYLKSKPMIITVLVAGTVSVMAYSMPHKLGLLLAALAGIIAGVGSEAIASRTSS